VRGSAGRARIGGGSSSSAGSGQLLLDDGANE
jgi:hypothetical protein